jgi:hypothetical protein
MHEHFAACCFLFGVCNMLCCLKQVIHDSVELLKHFGIISSAPAFYIMISHLNLIWS